MHNATRVVNRSGIFLMLTTIILTLLACPTVHAYVGPGAGLGMLGSLIAVAAAVVLAVVGVLILPIRLLRNKLRKPEAPRTAAVEEDEQAGETPPGQ